MLCPACKVELELGQAIRPEGIVGGPPRCGRPCFAGPTILTHEYLSFQFCGKCPKCGHSDNDVRQWKDEIIERVGEEKWKDEYEYQFQLRRTT